MVRAKDFLNVLCEECDYRFFSGVACSGLSPIYDKMSSRFMHYIPAVNECVAYGLVSGSVLAGAKSVLLIEGSQMFSIKGYMESVGVLYKLPCIIITYELGKDEDYWKFPFYYFNDCDNNGLVALKEFISRVERESIPGILVIEEGDLI